MQITISFLFFTIFLLEKCLGKYHNDYDIRNFYPNDFEYYSPKCEKAFENAMYGVVYYPHLSPKEKIVVELMLHIAYSGTLESKKNSERFYQGNPPLDFPNWKCYTIDYEYFLNKLSVYGAILVFISAMIYILNIICKIIYFLSTFFNCNNSSIN
jgi:hypothetical protein